MFLKTSSPVPKMVCDCLLCCLRFCGAFRQGVAQYTRLYIVYMANTAWIWTKISASRSAGKSVQGQLILITLPDLFRPATLGAALESVGRSVGRSFCRRRWSVPCIQLETANTCWKCPFPLHEVLPKKTHLWVNCRAVLPTVTKYGNQRREADSGTGSGSGFGAASVCWHWSLFVLRCVIKWILA